MKFIKCLLVVTLFFFSCNEKCDPPECARPKLNHFASLTLQFCVDTDDDSCFSEDELTEVIFTQKRAVDDTVSTTSIFLSDENNFSVYIGGDESSGFLFIGQELERYSLLEVEYFYEIEVLATGDFFTIKDLKRAPDAPCTCPNYNFESAKVNDISINVIENVITLKK